jgi:hypothetical protein
VGGAAAYGLGGFDWVAQQATIDQLRPGSPSPPGLVGERVVVASTDRWGVLAWRSTERGLCVDVAFRGQGGTGCGFPVEGATPEHLAPGEQQLAAGVGTLEGRGPHALVGGVAAPDVGGVDLRLVDGRTVPTTVYDAPFVLATDLHVFVTRFEYTGPFPPEPLGAGGGIVDRYVAYDDAGRLLGSYPRGPPRPGRDRRLDSGHGDEGRGL